MQFEPQTRLRRLVSAPDAEDLVRDHRFRVHSLKTVGVCIVACAVCERVIMSTTKNQWGYRCEDCGLDVHKACMMAANTNLPCPNRISNDIDSSSTSPRVRYVRSPQDRSGGYLLIQPPRDGGNQPPLLHFGKLYVNLQGIHLCSKLCKGGDEHAANVFEGDTYCRMSVDGLSHESKEVYKSHDPVFDEKTCFVITHRDATFQLELIDLSTNIVLGSMQILLFELLQMDADDVIQSLSSKLALFPPPQHKFNQILTKYSLKLKQNVVGYARMTLHYEEEKQKLLLYVPKQRMVLQGREEKEFAVETLKTNMDRLVRVFQLIPWLEQQYLALITWKNKPRSALVLLTFTLICLFLNAEYMPALFFYLAIVYMCYTFILRLSGDYLHKWVAFDEDPMENTKLYRPVATLQTAVVQAALPAPQKKDNQYVFVKVFYLPNDSNQEDSGLVYSGGEEFLIGRTHAVRYNVQPKWRDAPNVTSHLNPSGLYRPNAPPKKEYVFRNVHVSWPHAQSCACSGCSNSSTKAVDYHTIVYPLLQAAKHFDNGRELLVPWSMFPGLLRFDVYCYGEENVTIEKLVGSSTITLASYMNDQETTIQMELDVPTSEESTASLSSNLTVRLQIKLPKKPFSTKTTMEGVLPAEKKWSTFLRDALAEKDKTSTLSTVLFGALWKAKDTTKMVQNGIGRLCATVVCTQNLFNWTHPWKTGLVFVVCIAGAILFSLVPARYIILIGGYMEFIAGLREDRPPSNTARNILWNFISSLPTDTDLIQAYDQQRSTYVERRSAVEKTENEISRRLKFQSLWIGNVLMKMEQDRTWKTMCVAYRPCRFVFWKSIEDADAFLPPLGQLIIDRLEDIKEIPDLMARKAEEPPFIFYVLGNTGESYQEKRFFGFQSSAHRDELLQAVKASFSSN